MRILMAMTILLCLVGISCDDDDDAPDDIVIKPARNVAGAPAAIL